MLLTLACANAYMHVCMSELTAVNGG